MAKKNEPSESEYVAVVEETEIIDVTKPCCEDDEQNEGKYGHEAHEHHHHHGLHTGQDEVWSAHTVSAARAETHSGDLIKAKARCAIAAHKSLQVALGALVVFDTTMKGVAVVTAMRRGDDKWILPLAVFNTVGILPAIYLSTRH